MLASDPSEEEISAALSHLLGASGFQVSDRNRRFLRYVVNETLAGRGARIKSYTIAVDVFGRGPDFDGSADSIVRTEATRLRSALTRYYTIEGAQDPILITLPPGSYLPQFQRRLITAGAEREPELERAPSPPTQPMEIPLPPPPPRRRPAALAIAFVAAIAIIALLLARLFHVPFFPRNAPTIVLSTTQYLGDKPKIQDIALGLTQSLVLALGRYDGLVIAQTSERQPVDAVVAHQERKGGTVYILESSVEGDETKLRFRWRLIDAQDQVVIWSDQDDELLGESSPLSVEDKIAEGVARLVGVRGGILGVTEQNKQGSHSTTGYACVLRAMYYTSTLSVRLHAEVRDCLEQTIAEDPNYAQALALLSYVYADEDRNGFNPRGNKAEILARALAVSDRAVQLAPSSSLAQQMRSTVFFQLGDIPAFENAARKAIALNPSNPPRSILFGNRLFALGRYEESAKIIRKALEAEPFPSAVEHGFSLLESYRLGNYRAAADEAETLDIDRDFYFMSVILAAIYGQLGDHAAASANVAAVLRLRPDYAKTFRADWRNRRFREDFIEKMAEGLRKAGLPVE
jgi:Tfp pilus assembly protein PilF